MIDLEWLQSVATIENVQIDVVGTVTNDKTVTVMYGKDVLIDHAPLDRPYTPREYKITYPSSSTPQLSEQLSDSSFYQKIIDTLHRLDVGSKRFLTSKVDRSVTGHVVQQSCVGPFETPISDYALYTSTLLYPIPLTLVNPRDPYRYYPAISGCVTAIGERPLTSLDPDLMVRYTFYEVLTNLVGVLLDRSVSNIFLDENVFFRGILYWLS